jgi:ribosomal protein S27AE
MTVDLDERTISLNKAIGIDPQDVKDILHSTVSHVTDVANPPHITKKKKEQIIGELERRGANRPCPRCGNSSFTLLDGYFNQPITSDLSGAVIIPGTSVPSVITACTQCGFLAQHALGALGLLEGGDPQ